MHGVFATRYRSRRASPKPSRPCRRGSSSVRDRPYVASSFLSVALAKVYGSALSGRCSDKPGLAAKPLDLAIRIDVVPCRGASGDGQIIRDLFEPLGYAVETTHYPLDEKFPQWGEGPYFSVTLRAQKPLSEVDLYVLLPVLDNDKHYWVDQDEARRLARGEGWLPDHPAKERITNRYLKHQRSLTRDALARLTVEEQVDPDADAESHDQQEEAVERPMSLNDQRHAAVLAALKGSGAKRVLDLGCAQGKLLRRLPVRTGRGYGCVPACLGERRTSASSYARPPA